MGVLNISHKKNLGAVFYTSTSPIQQLHTAAFVSKYAALQSAKRISIVYDHKVNINLDEQEMNPSRGVLLKPRLASSNSQMHKTMCRLYDNVPAG